MKSRRIIALLCVGLMTISPILSHASELNGEIETEVTEELAEEHNEQVIDGGISEDVLTIDGTVDDGTADDGTADEGMAQDADTDGELIEAADEEELLADGIEEDMTEADPEEPGTEKVDIHRIPYLRIGFDAGEGTFGPATEHLQVHHMIGLFQKGETITGYPGGDPTWDGRAFLGWAKEEKPHEVVMSREKPYTITGGENFVAVYEGIPLTGASADNVTIITDDEYWPGQAVRVLEENVAQQVVLTKSGSAVFKFVPKTSGYYFIRGNWTKSETTADASLHYADGMDCLEQCWASDWGTEDRKMHMVRKLTAGETYYVDAFVYGSDTLTVKVSQTKVYTVTWDANGGGFYGYGSDNGKYRIIESAGYPLTTAFTRAGRGGGNIFGCWSLSPTEFKPAFSASKPYYVNSDTTIYAVWKTNYKYALEENVPYRLIFDEWDGYYHMMFTPSADGTYHFSSYAPSSAQLDPKADLVWSDSILQMADNENGKQFEVTYDLNAGEVYDLRVRVLEGKTGDTFYVKAVPDQAAQVTWDANGGTFTSDPSKTQIEKTVGVGAKITSLADDTPAKEGVTWIGWALSPEAAEADFDEGHPYKVTGDVTFYAVYSDAPNVTLTRAGNVVEGVELAWKAEGDFASFILERREGSGSWEQIAETTETSYTDTNCVTGHIYWYRVLGVGMDGVLSGPTDMTGKRVAREFLDVPLSGKYYSNAVYWAGDANITKGYTKTNTFGVGKTCTRADMVTFLWRLAGCPEPETETDPFRDVSPTKYYYKAVLWAAENGITKGYEYGYFRPSWECRREHAVMFLWRMAGCPEPSATKNPFVDVDKSDYYYKAVLWASESGIANGYVEETTGKKIYKPYADCLREHIVTFIYRYAQRY